MNRQHASRGCQRPGEPRCSHSHPRSAPCAAGEKSGEGCARLGLTKKCNVAKGRVLAARGRGGGRAAQSLLVELLVLLGLYGAVSYLRSVLSALMYPDTHASPLSANHGARVALEFARGCLVGKGDQRLHRAPALVIKGGVTNADIARK